MTLTPSDIEQKTFSTALRGYNLDEVDDFLDEVVRSMRKLHDELDAARTELEAKPTQPAPAPEPARVVEPTPSPVVEPPPPPVVDESAVGKALIAAQETADRIVTDARAEADRILLEAQSEADSFEETRLQRKAEAEQEIKRIDGLVERVKGELAGLSAAVGTNLDDMSAAIDGAESELEEMGPDATSEESGDDDSEEEEDADADSSAPATAGAEVTSSPETDDTTETASGQDEAGNGDADEYFIFPEDGDDSEDSEDDEDSEDEESR
ncbi:MAG: DivIVA domain-containing protein [Actinobacteria bacterium]|nr:MAG: DivIVA domain-containing protein [Actinomycetota bacterium]